MGLNMKVIFSERAFTSIIAETTERVHTETGGLFLGTFKDDNWLVIESIDPGPNSIFEVDYFEYDQKYVEHLINKIANLYDEKLELIGLWHRHPGSMDVFSVTDGFTNSKYANMRQQGAISALVNVDPNFRLTVYHVQQPCRYSRIEYIVGNGYIPKDILKLRKLNEFESIMRSVLNANVKRNRYNKIKNLSTLMDEILPFIPNELSVNKFMNSDIDIVRHNMSDIRNQMIENLLSDIMFISDKLGIKILISQDKNLFVMQDLVDNKIHIDFKYSDSDGMLCCYDGKIFKYRKSLFEKLLTFDINL